MNLVPRCVKDVDNYLKLKSDHSTLGDDNKIQELLNLKRKIMTNKRLILKFIIKRFETLDKNYIEQVLKILNKSMDPNIVNYDSELTLYQYIIKTKNIELFRVIYENFDTANSLQNSLMFALKYGATRDIIEFICSKNTKYDVFNTIIKFIDSFPVKIDGFLQFYSLVVPTDKYEHEYVNWIHKIPAFNPPIMEEFKKLEDNIITIKRFIDSSKYIYCLNDMLPSFIFCPVDSLYLFENRKMIKWINILFPDFENIYVTAANKVVELLLREIECGKCVVEVSREIFKILYLYMKENNIDISKAYTKYHNLNIIELIRIIEERV